MRVYHASAQPFRRHAPPGQRGAPWLSATEDEVARNEIGLIGFSVVHGVVERLHSLPVGSHVQPSNCVANVRGQCIGAPRAGLTFLDPGWSTIRV